jgi:hypothetical protein
MFQKLFLTLKTIPNGKNLYFLIMTLLLLASTASLYVASVKAPTPGEGNYPEIPGGVPDNAVQYNKTDTTPVSEMTQVKAGEPALFRYRNMTMLMNCTQNCTLSVTADPEVTPKTLGLSIDPHQTMTLTMNMCNSPPEGEQMLERALNFYLGLEPNAELQLNAQLRLHINQTELNQELNKVMNASELTWMYWNRTRVEWEPIESYMDQNGYLVCNTDHLSTWTVAENGNATVTPETSNYPEIPNGIPANAVQYNKTYVTPTREVEQVKAGEPALFRYRNMTMLMNCTQNCDLIVTVDPKVTPKILKLDIDANQTMTLSMNMSGSPLQGEHVAERALNFYLGLEPEAEVQLKIQLQLLINQTELNQELDRVVNASELKWMYWNGTQAQWTPVESYMDQNGYLVINTNHLSTWTVAEVSNEVEPPPDTTQGRLPMIYVYIGLIAVVLAVIVIGIIIHSKDTSNPQHQ